jgi:Amidohydrolase
MKQRESPFQAWHPGFRAQVSKATGSHKMIIDTHVHIVAPDQQRYPRKLAPNNSDWVIDMPGEAMLELMRKAGIDRAILVQAHSAYEFDNSYVADVAIAYPERFVGVCIIDPTRADAVEELTYWVKERGRTPPVSRSRTRAALAGRPAHVFTVGTGSGSRYSGLRLLAISATAAVADGHRALSAGPRRARPFRRAAS